MNELVRDWKAEKKDLEEAFDIIADKLVKADAEVTYQRALITELCDALESEIGSPSPSGYRNLLQRAREATRYEL